VYDFIDTWRGSGSWSCDIGALVMQPSKSQQRPQSL